MKVTIEVELPEYCDEDTCRFCDGRDGYCTLFNVPLSEYTGEPLPQCIAARKEAGK